MSKDELKRLRAILELRAKDGRVDRFEALVRADERKKWVGLTDKERQEIYENNESWWEQSLRTEAKLKEKNEQVVY